MSDIMPDSTTTDTERPTFTIWDDIRWGLACRTNRLGNYLCKLGDRIQGDEPMGLTEAWDAGRSRAKQDEDSVCDIFDAGREYQRRVTAREAATE
jgi:hypothetical protein